jgi:hypothetical protein
MKEMRLESLLVAQADHSLIANQEADEIIIDNLNVDRCIFENVGLRHAKLLGGRATHCQFVRAYLRNATFANVVLTGTEFSNCNLKYATFEECDLRYVSFHNCDLPYEALLDNLPEKAFHKKALLRALRINAIESGDLNAVNKIFLQEMKAERDEFFSILKLKKDVDDERTIGVRSWVRALLGWVSHLLQWHILGYGFRFLIVLRTAILIIFLAAICYSQAGATFRRSEDPGKVITLGFWEASYFSTITFSTVGYGDLVPVGQSARALASFEAGTGAIFIGVVAATIYRRLQR